MGGRGGSGEQRSVGTEEIGQDLIPIIVDLHEFFLSFFLLFSVFINCNKDKQGKKRNSICEARKQRPTESQTHYYIFSPRVFTRAISCHHRRRVLINLAQPL